MANIVFNGNQVDRAAVVTVTVTAAGTGSIAATINSQTETYTTLSTDSVTTAASNAVSAFKASPIPEMGLLSWTNPSAGVIVATGPSDGRPVSISLSASGATTITTSTTVSATSSHDISDAANFVGGTLPGGSDNLVLDNSSVDIRYGFAHYSSLATTLERRPSYTGNVGLSDVNPLGFPEFLPTRLTIQGLSLKCYSGGTGTTRVVSTASSPVTVIATGTSQAELLEVSGLPSGSVLDANRIGVVVSPLFADTSIVGTALIANQGSIRAGAGVTITSATVKNATANFSGTVTNLICDKSANVTMQFGASCTTQNILGGVVNWNSTGATGTVTIGNGGKLDLTNAPASVATSGITVNSGGSLIDPYKRLSSYTLAGNDWESVKNLLSLGTSFSLNVT